MRPPRAAEWLLGRLLPRLERSEILGDTAERFERLAASQGRVQARLWYWRQALAIPFHLRWGERGMGLELQEWRYALRTLSRSPGFTVVAVLTLAVAIGASTAIFSIVNAVMLRPLPYPDPDRMVQVWEHNDTFGRLAGAWVNFADWRAQNGSFADMAGYQGRTQTVLGGAEPLRAGVAPVSEGFFRVVGVQPAVGRGFGADEHALGADPVVVISDDFWRTQLGGVSDLGEISLNVAGFPTTVVGVMPPGFDFPVGTDVWYPLELEEQAESRTAHNWRIIGRLAPGIDPEQAQEDLSLITARFDPAGEPNEYMPQRALVVPLRQEISGPVRNPLYLLLGASALVLLVGCTNLASTLLARGSARAGEMSLLRALGAERGRLVRRLFIESLMLALLGAAFGLLLAYALIRALPVVLPSNLPRVAEIGMHPTVAAFSVAASCAAALLFGLFPAFRVSEAGMSEPLSSGSRSVSVARSRGPWRALVVGEVAMAVLLLAGAGLLMRSLWEVARVDPGFEPGGVLTVNLALPEAGYAQYPPRVALFDTLLERVDALPGVESSGMVVSPPLRGYPSTGRISIDGGPEPFVTASYQVADTGFFETLRIPLIRGRLFEPADGPDSAHVVVVNETLAELAWPDGDALGKRLTGGGMDSYWDQPDAWATVVGVVADIHQRDLTRESYPAFFFSYRQRADRVRVGSIVIRAGRVGPTSLVAGLRDLVREIDADVPAQFTTMDEIVSSSLGDRRFLTGVLAAFAIMALSLAALGIYGVVAYTVALRRREMGIRIALGAAPKGVVGMVLRESMTTVIIGLLVGLGAALALGRMLSSQLFEVSAADPLSLVVTALVLVAVAAFASVVPAQRAASVDPLLTMRAD